VIRVNFRNRLLTFDRPATFYVTDRNSLPGANPVDLLSKIRMAAAASCDFVQIREKDMSASLLLQLTREAIRAATRAGSTRVFVNDRLDVALAGGAAGVHLGEASLPVGTAIPWCRSGNAPADFLVGVSCHSLEHVLAAEKEGASYVFFGPIFDSPSKRSFGAPQGVERLQEVCRAVKIPVIAIGGVDQTNAALCIGAGAAGVAAIRMFQDTNDAESLAAAISGIHALALS
jgi:thiamine-phosphate pyrophosphorylase